MHNLTLVLGILLVCIGLGGYFASHGASVTALIPSFLGIPVILLGFSARRDRWRKRALHVAAALAFLGVIGSFSAPGCVGLPRPPNSASGVV